MEQKHDIMEEEKIDLLPILRTFCRELRRFWLLVLLLAVACGGLLALRASHRYVPMYRTEAMLTATINSSGSTDLISSSYYYNNEAAKQAAATFPALLNSDAMRERLKLELGADYINGSISSAPVPGTNFLVLSVSSPSPEDAYAILNAVLKVYPQVSRLVIGDTQLSITDAATLPTEPYNPFSWKPSAIRGAVLGLVLGLAILLLLSNLNQTVSTPENAQTLINLSCLAEVPNIRSKRRSRKGQVPLLLLTNQESDSAFSEAFRLLRLKLLRHMKSGEEKVILVTSTLPAEGKSSVSINMALSLARDGKKVLLIDGDLRSQNIKTLLGLHMKSTGLLELLNQTTDEIRFIPYPNSSLFLLAGDSTCGNPTPLLNYDALQVIMDVLRPRFDYIILDTPPCAMMADAAAFARHCDKIIYVIREDYVTRSQLADAILSLSGAETEICGFVMNRASDHGHRRGYGYGYGKYGYGYKYGNYGKYGKYGKYGYHDKKRDSGHGSDKRAKHKPET